MKIEKFNEGIAVSKLNYISSLIFGIWKDDILFDDIFLSEYRDGIYFNFRFNLSYISYNKWKVLLELLLANKIEWVFDKNQPQFCMYFVDISTIDNFLIELEMLNKSNKYNL
jgi:hypothetical protein